MYERPMPVSIWPNLEKGGYDIYSHTLKKIVGWASTMDSAQDLANKLYNKTPYRE
jgi:hypothetical protein